MSLSFLAVQEFHTDIKQEEEQNGWSRLKTKTTATLKTINYKFSRTMKQIFKTKILNCSTLVSLNIVLLLCKIRTHFPHYLPLLWWYSLALAVGLPDHSGSDLSTEEDAQGADCFGGEHTDSGEANGEMRIHCTCGICRRIRRHKHGDSSLNMLCNQ